MILKLQLAISLISVIGASAQPVFTDVASDLDLTHQYTGGWEHFVGGGIASFDCDADLLPELYVAGGASSASLFRNKSSRGGDVNMVNDTPVELALTDVTGAYPVDIDSDGLLDLFIMRVGENYLMKGGPDCSFKKFDLGFDGGDRWTTAFSATWEAGNTMPTMAIGNYVNRKDPDGPFEACDTNFLMRPDNRQYSSIPLIPSFCPLSMLFSDWGRSGRQDLRTSNDRHYYVRGGNEQLWAIEDTPRLYDESDGWSDFSIWGMGIASRDLSGDGYPDVFLTSMGDQKMQVKDASVEGPTFLNATYERGTTAHRPYTGGDGRPSTGWHVEFGDVDNDGLDDVFIAKGNVEQMPGSAMSDPNNLLVQNTDGTFIEMGLEAGVASMDRSRGAALIDINLDGMLDLVIVNRRAPVEVYQNDTQTTGNWLLLDVRQSGINSRAVGGWLEVSDGNNIWHREITIGGGHASGSSTFAHFGLGNSDAIELRIIWPDGALSDWLGLDANQILRLDRSEDNISVTNL
ncbi:hypothetical protein A9Q96_15000 [Rhodobacterales bacterium 52_120_T64]|nr:hypothetical protein A9Q96_15000 [Rhodobacterales bacterium 52_120_T64]